ncbi:hypothetical protein AgCh_004259 [Apium graveolens]
MGRRPCCDKSGLNRGPWTADEDKKLFNFVLRNSLCCWRDVPKHAGLLRCGKSCRLRYVNYLRPDLKRGLLSEYEEKLVIDLHSQLGNRWSKIASHMPGRTDNEIKNLWHTNIKKKLIKMGIDPLTHRPLHADPLTDNHQNHDVQSQEHAELQSREEMQEQAKCQENDGISLMLEDSIITNTDDSLAKEKVAMDINDGFFTHEIESREILPNSDLRPSSSSTTVSATSASSSMSTNNLILGDLKFVPSFEDWLSDGHSEIYTENMGFTYEDDSIDWDRLLNDFDIDKIDHELIQSLPDPDTADQEWFRMKTVASANSSSL